MFVCWCDWIMTGAGYLFIISVRHTLTNADKLPPALPHQQLLEHIRKNLPVEDLTLSAD